MRRVVVLSMAAGALALMPGSSAMAEEPCGDGQVTQAIHGVHEAAEQLVPPAGEPVHDAECAVAPVDPT